MKKFVVIGLGSFGRYAAKELVQKGNEVVVIDDNKDKIDDIKKYVNQAIIADASKIDVLKEINITDYNAVIVSVGPDIESSILVVHHLRQLNVKHIIAKALSDDHYELLKTVGATKIIYPEKEEALRLAGVLSFKNVMEYIPITDEYHLIEINCPSKYQDKSIRELDIRKRFSILIIGIKINGNSTVEIPDPEIILNSRHSLFLLGEKKNIDKFLS
ncbi:TrkA family potassium uptake protein [Candidatus Dependentiae bacterium]|nr:TrkA family potassium uptake protein [Candidatus Dependentiae bacterium]